MNVDSDCHGLDILLLQAPRMIGLIKSAVSIMAFCVIWGCGRATSPDSAQNGSNIGGSDTSQAEPQTRLVTTGSTPEEMWLIRHLELLSPQGYPYYNYPAYDFDEGLTPNIKTTIVKATCALVLKVEQFPSDKRRDFVDFKVVKWALLTGRQAERMQIFSNYGETEGQPGDEFHVEYIVRLWDDERSETVDLLISLFARGQWAMDSKELRVCQFPPDAIPSLKKMFAGMPWKEFAISTTNQTISDDWIDLTAENSRPQQNQVDRDPYFDKSRRRNAPGR